MSIALNGDGIISGVSSITVGAGASVFSPAANTLALGTNGSERVRINSSGNIGIGSDIPGAKLDIQGGEFYYHSGTSNNLGIKLTYSNGNSTGIIDTYGNHALEIRTNNTEKLRVLAAGGLTFNGDTAAANALDDYEEGTWTPILMTNLGAVSTATLTSSGIYLKVGNLVQVHGSITVTDIGNADGFGVGGLPFSCTAYASFGAGWLSGAANSVIGVRAESVYGTRVLMRGQNTSAWNGFSGVSIFTTGTVFEFGMTYRTT